MSEYIHLIGAGDVKRASSEMDHAAETIRRAVAEFGDHISRLQRILEEDRDARGKEEEVRRG